MINRRQTRHRGAWLTLAMAGLLQACQTAPAPTAAAPGTRVYSADMTGGARSCEVPKVSLTNGQPTDASMKVTNDGGWCGIPVTQQNGKVFGAGLLTVRPTHGTVLIHQVGDVTRVDYTPDRGFAGTDAFTVKLIPGDSLIRTSVTVTSGK